ncbi:response regulator [Hyalangium rubrum]|uniref:Response regulator n=1 Tax=Hyalangium rubrum TaxID=3103134 RepID=A0ABU5GWX4_9BACT|nr:response regulator [Hyalangium sp. s54d21]MDY7224983.1 response regulator [Hyalangium sp. s54d21]
MGPSLMAKILIVDDEVQVASALRRLFRREGFAVEVALNGDEALQKLTTFDADLVISDFRMKGMNGAELLEKVLRVSPRAVRILLSGHADLWSSAPTSAAQAVSHFISKPWDDDHLVARVRTLLGEQEPSASNP